MSELHVRVLVGPELVADPDLLQETVDAELPGLEVPGRLVTAPDPDALRGALAEAGRDGTAAVVVLPGPDPAARGLMREPGRHADRTVWCDLTRTGPVPVAGGGAHLSGRGLWGLTWAVRHAVHRVRHPARRIRYGAHPEQWGELRTPPGSGPDSAPEPLPVAVLVHGGYWRSAWGADLMDALAVDLAARGFAAWNLEYRRPDRHGWEATTADVAAGLAAPGRAGAEGGPGAEDGRWRDRALDRDRVVVIGHSAGGQLALRAAADAGRVALAVSLAGVLDLAEGERRGMGTGAVTAALGGGPEAVPGAYAAADPLARLPLGTPQLVVQGRDDDLDLVDCARRYARAARAAGDEVSYLERPGGHFAVIDPATGIWRETAARIRAAVAGSRGPVG